MQWENKLFIDAVLPFGLRSAVAEVLEWHARFKGVAHVLHYLDDFLMISLAESPKGSQDLNIIRNLFDRLHVPVAPEKVKGPATQLTYLGIEMDTENLILHLPENKLSTLKEMIGEWLTRKSCTIRNLQSLAGKFLHAFKVVHPGWTFLRRIFELLKGCGRNQSFVCRNAAFKSDLM